MSKKKNKSSRRKQWRLWSAVALVTILLLGGLFVSYAFHVYDGNRVWVYVPANADDKQLCDSLRMTLGDEEGMRVYRLWWLMGGDVQKSYGAYQIAPGDYSVMISRRLKKSMQTPKKVVWTDTRKFEQLAQKVTANINCTDQQFLAACDSILPLEGLKKEEYAGAFIPDTYEFYWNVTPEDLVKKLRRYYHKFWTEERLGKAEKLGLTPIEVAIIASIVEEETAKRDEQGKVARLYINRLKKGMRLQADPTVKFAVGDFTIRRITAQHLHVVSPYNTYIKSGLPPGPIRTPDKRTIDAVLDAPEHDYIYMCAKEDFSGYHNFAVDYSTHLKNARRYQAELNRRNIK